MFIYKELSGVNMADKTLADIAAERGIELTEIDLDSITTKLEDKPNDILWWQPLEELENYNILALWPSIVVQKDDEDSVQEFMSNMGCKHPIKLVGCVETLPDWHERNDEEPTTGGRIDLAFYFHSEDIYRIAVRRLQHGIRWWEDVVANDIEHGLNKGMIYEEYTIYPEDFRAFAGDGGYDTNKTVEQHKEGEEE
jgi:hypothetical protein